MVRSKATRLAWALGSVLAITAAATSASAKSCAHPKLTLSLLLTIDNTGDQFFYVFTDQNAKPSPYVDQWGNLDFSKSPGSIDVTITLKDSAGTRDFDPAYPLYYAEGLTNSDVLNPVRPHHHQIQNISPAAGVIEFCYMNDNTGGHAGGNNPYGRYAIALVDTIDQQAAPIQIDPGIQNGGSSGGPGPK